MDEFELIERIFSHLTGEDDSVRCGIGDDAAILDFPGGSDLVVTTDTLVSGVHFFPHVEPQDIGYKSLAVNLSDMAAMAAQPRWTTLSLTLPEADTDWIAAYSRGFADAARDFGVSLVGGDLTRGPLSITCQLLGTVTPGGGVRRSGARRGDVIYVSGTLGLAAMALKLLGPEGDDIDAVPSACMTRLLRPVPRVELGLALADIAGAMIDLSDGLAGDLAHILEASGVGAEVEWDRLPVSDVQDGLDERSVRQLAAAGGDDYELCFTVPEHNMQKLEELTTSFNFPLTRIGRIVSGSGVRWLDAGGNTVDLEAESYHHF